MIESLPFIPEYRLRIELWATFGCVILLVAVIELVRRNRMKERYSFLWLATAGVLIVFALRRAWLEDLARLVGIYYPPTALLLILVFFMLLMLIHFSTVISKLISDKQSVVQSLGILEARVRELENEKSAGLKQRAPGIQLL